MKRIIAKTVTAVAVASLSAIPVEVSAHASGTNLYAWCLSAARAEKRLCNGYILGIADAMEESKRIGEFAACIPPAVRTRNPGRLYHVAQQFLASHPEKRQRSAASLVASAFAEAFPCP